MRAHLIGPKVRPGSKPIGQPDNSGKITFLGTFAELKWRLFLVGLPGGWVDRGDLRQFYTTGGAVLNWWPSKKAIQFQGPVRESEDFEWLFCNVPAPA